MKFFYPLLLSAIVSGCATAGREISESQIDTLKRGETTIQEAVTALGSPTGTTKSADGKQVLVYSFSHAQARPASFIPVVGLFAGGADVRSSAVVLTFDRSGILQDYSVHRSSTGMGTGASAGIYQTPDMSQPAESPAK